MQFKLDKYAVTCLTNVTFRLVKIIKLNVARKITAISACNRQATLILRGVVVMQEVYKNCLQDNPQVQFQHFLYNNQRQLLASHHEWAFKAAALGLFTRVPARISDNTSPFCLRPICATLPA